MNFPFWYTYIVTDETDSVFYTGVVSTLEKRWYEQGVLSPDRPLAKLPKFLPYDYKLSKLVWFAGFTRYAQAKAFEQKLKRWHRQRKLELVMHTNPTMKNLADKNKLTRFFITAKPVPTFPSAVSASPAPKLASCLCDSGQSRYNPDPQDD